MPRRPVRLLARCCLAAAAGCATPALGPPCAGPDGLGPPAPPPSPAAPPADEPGAKPHFERLEIPPEIPGAGVAPLVLPPSEKRTMKELLTVYPKLPPLGDEPEPAPGPDGRALTLADLQAIALATSPTVRQAQLDVDAARGAAVQAGLYPNPNVGYQGDQMQPPHNAGQQGGYVEQLIKTAGKLDLARAAATMDLHNAQLALRRAQVDQVSRVRANYFAVLMAHEYLSAARAMARITAESYRIQIAQVAAGPAAAYEPLQLYALGVQAHTAVEQYRNRYLSAWKQLAASLNRPEMPPTRLAGRADASIPEYPFEAARERILADHTDVGTAHNAVLRARYNLRLQEVTPVPDVQNHVYVQRDNGFNPARFQFGIQAGVALPLWDRNQGNVASARAQLGRSIEELPRVRIDLSRRLADAYERYATNRTIVTYYREQVLPNQVRVYRGVSVRYQAEGGGPGKGDLPAVNYNDVVTAQQTLSASLTTYLTALGGLWQAVVDLAELLQTDDLYILGGEACGRPSPVDQLLGPETLPEPRRQ